MADHIDRGPAETRIATVEDGRLVAMRVHRAGDGARAGDVWGARALSRAARSVRLGDEIALLDAWPEGLTEGAAVAVEVIRAAIPEHGRLKPARARDLALKPKSDGLQSRRTIRGTEGWTPPIAEQWDEAWDAAERGRLRFGLGALVLTPTPAHLAVDVDGDGPAEALALAAVLELARAIRLFGIGGSVVADLPALDRAARVRVADAFGAACALSHERTAINGFGLFQVVLARTGPSILERARFEPAATAAAALVRAALADHGTGAMQLAAPPTVAAWLEARPAVLAEVVRRTGRPCGVRADASLHAGHVAPA